MINQPTAKKIATSSATFSNVKTYIESSFLAGGYTTQTVLGITKSGAWTWQATRADNSAT